MSQFISTNVDLIIWPVILALNMLCEKRTALYILFSLYACALTQIQCDKVLHDNEWAGWSQWMRKYKRGILSETLETSGTQQSVQSYFSEFHK